MKSLTRTGNAFLLMVIGFMLVLLTSIFMDTAFAQAVGDVLVEPSSSEIMAFLAALGGLKGAGSLAIAAAAVQGVMLLLRSKLGDFAGKFRILIVVFLSLVSGVIALKLNGVDIGAALVHSSSMASFQVFLNQLYKQFFVKED